MNKEELVKTIALETGFTQRACEAMLNTCTKAMIAAVASGERVSLVGFGSFTTLNRKARGAINPLTGKKIRIPAKKVPKFIPGKEFRNKIK
jgi:DNA-binding protein HU-beta